MKTNATLFWILAIFFFLMCAVYVLWSLLDTGQVEWAGTLGIGLADQSLQQYLGNPVIGKILVLAAIILFLQWRPAGLFVTRSRSLD